MRMSPRWHSGLVTKMALCGKDDGSDGDTLAVPGIRFEYDFFAFMNDGDPIWVRKIARENHVNAPYINTLPPDEQNATIETAEYSDGYGRQVQSRAKAEDVIYGNQTFGDSGLPANQADPNQPAIGTQRESGDPLNVVVSGHKRYNNKGEVVEQYEPYFSSGFDYAPDDTPAGVAIKMYYDPLGRMVRKVNPDHSEQRVVFGIPRELDTPEDYRPTPWERYHYSPNDLASITNPGSGVPQASWWTPKYDQVLLDLFIGCPRSQIFPFGYVWFGNHKSLSNSTFASIFQILFAPPGLLSLSGLSKTGK